MKPWWRAIVSLLAGAGIVALAACSSSKLPERFHTLLPAEHAASAAPSAPPLYIDVLPVSVPRRLLPGVRAQFHRFPGSAGPRSALSSTVSPATRSRDISSPGTSRPVIRRRRHRRSATRR